MMFAVRRVDMNGIGAFWDRKLRILYLFLPPWIGVRIGFRNGDERT
jgi:uncharacterized membrane protein